MPDPIPTPELLALDLVIAAVEESRAEGEHHLASSQQLDLDDLRDRLEYDLEP